MSSASACTAGRQRFRAAEWLEHQHGFVKRLGAIQLEFDPVHIASIQRGRKDHDLGFADLPAQIVAHGFPSPAGRLSGVLVLR
jgi:hypothetical protein